MPFLAESTERLLRSSVQVRGEGTELPDVFDILSTGEQWRSKGKIQVIPILTAGSVSGLRDCMLLSRLLSSLPAQTPLP